MGKIIIKEVGIVILLIIAVALLLSIVLYDYIPNNKTVPIKVEAYNMPEDIQDELNEAIPDEQSIVKTFYIDDSDLNLYEDTNEYDKGKANPFADYSKNADENSIENETNTNEVYINSPGKNY